MKGDWAASFQRWVNDSDYCDAMRALFLSLAVYVCCSAVLLCTVAANNVQIGNSFPGGIVIGGENATCDSESVNTIRFVDGRFEVCSSSGSWSQTADDGDSAATTLLQQTVSQLHDLTEAVTQLQTQVDEASARECGEPLNPESWQATLFCSGRGEFVPTDDPSQSPDSCECYDDNVHGHYVGFRCQYCLAGWVRDEARNCRVDVEDPVLTLLGANPLTIEADKTASYEDPGVSVIDNGDGDQLSSSVVQNTVDLGIPGSYVYVFSATDSFGNTANVSRTVVVVDATPPTVTLIGASPLTVEAGSLTEYVDAGATTADNAEGEIALELVATLSESDLRHVGVHQATYEATDVSGNQASKTRNVEVIDTTLPVLSISPESTQTLSVTLEGGTYTANELLFLVDDIIVTDNSDASIAIQIANPLDATVPGDYDIVFSATDPSGNAAVDLVRSVSVVDTTAPIISLIGDADVTVAQYDEYVEAGATIDDHGVSAGNVSIVVSISGAVNHTHAGEYFVNYDVTDASGNGASTVTRRVFIAPINECAFGRLPLDTCKHRALGMESGAISDAQITASSRYSSTHHEDFARLNRNSDPNWSAGDNNNDNEYIQIAFSSPIVFAGVATQGRQGSSQWITSFRMLVGNGGSYSDLGVTFTGNVDQHTVVHNAFATPVIGDGIRLRVPNSGYHGHKSMRMEMYGCDYVPVCHTDASCTDSPESYSCTCNPGYEGDGENSCTDVDECSNPLWNNCDAVHGHCTNTIGSYECSCDPGYVLHADGFQCVDVDECEVYPDRCEAGCENLDGSYQCVCPTGFTLYTVPGSLKEFCFPADPIGCNDTLGVTLTHPTRYVADQWLSASSEYSETHTITRARLNLAADPNWSAGGNTNNNEYIQADVQLPHLLSGVATQGRYGSNQWITQFRLSYLDLNGALQTINDPNTGSPKVFVGNSDRHTVVKQVLDDAVVGRGFRIFVPNDGYVSHKSARFDIYGCPSYHSRALGVSNKIPDAQITSSSAYGGTHVASRARLGAAIDPNWSAAVNNVDEWIQVDLGTVHFVTGIATQGRYGSSQWITSYSISLSNDGSTFTPYQENGSTVIFNGNTDQHSIVQNTFGMGVNARFVRLYVKGYHSHTSMRFEVYGYEI